MLLSLLPLFPHTAGRRLPLIAVRRGGLLPHSGTFCVGIGLGARGRSRRAPNPGSFYFDPAGPRLAIWGARVPSPQPQQPRPAAAPQSREARSLPDLRTNPLPAPRAGPPKAARRLHSLRNTRRLTVSKKATATWRPPPLFAASRNHPLRGASRAAHSARRCGTPAMQQPLPLVEA
jgi:hypothetical protein